MLPYLFFDPLLFLEDWRSVKMGQSKRTKKLNWVYRQNLCISYHFIIFHLKSPMICMLTFRVPGFVQIWAFQVHIPNGSTVFSHFGWSRYVQVFLHIRLVQQCEERPLGGFGITVGQGSVRSPSSGMVRTSPTLVTGAPCSHAAYMVLCGMGVTGDTVWEISLRAPSKVRSLGALFKT